MLINGMRSQLHDLQETLHQMKPLVFQFFVRLGAKGEAVYEGMVRSEVTDNRAH